MNRETIVRAWKDPEFRASLSTEQRAALPECPSGESITELNDADLDNVVGGEWDDRWCGNDTRRFTTIWTFTHTQTIATGPQLSNIVLPGITP